MATGNKWTESELTLALGLYVITPFGRISRSNQAIKKLADILGRSPGSVQAKLANLAHCDPVLQARGIQGWANGSKLDRVVWDRYFGVQATCNIEDLVDHAQALYVAMGVQPTADLLPMQAPTTADSLAYKRRSPAPVDLDAQLSRLLQKLQSAHEAGTHTTRTIATQARRGQHIFRQTVMLKTEGACAITGCKIESMIEAAHILPWSSHPAHRLDVYNGLMLTNQLHSAFDANLLAITPYAKVQITKFWLDNCGHRAMYDFLRAIDGLEVNLGDRFQVKRAYLEERYESFLAHQPT